MYLVLVLVSTTGSIVRKHTYCTTQSSHVSIIFAKNIYNHIICVFTCITYHIIFMCVVKVSQCSSSWILKCQFFLNFCNSSRTAVKVPLVSLQPSKENTCTYFFKIFYPKSTRHLEPTIELPCLFVLHSLIPVKRRCEWSLENGKEAFFFIQ